MILLSIYIHFSTLKYRVKLINSHSPTLLIKWLVYAKNIDTHQRGEGTYPQKTKNPPKWELHWHPTSRHIEYKRGCIFV